MYQAKGFLKEGFTTTAKTPKGGEYNMYFEDADGPMDIFAVAYTGCIAMCVKGYFYRSYELVDLAVEVDLNVDYDNKTIVADIAIDRTDEQLDAGDRYGALENIKLRCKVSHLLSKDLNIIYNIKAMKKG